MRSKRILFGLVAALSCACGGVSCTSNGSPGATTAASGSCPASLNARPKGSPWSPPADPSKPVSAIFSVTIDPKNASLSSTWLQPHPEAVSIQGGGGGLRLWGGAKVFAKHPGRILVELFVINDGDAGLLGLEATVSGVTGSQSFYDFNTTEWSSPASPAPMLIGGVAPHGVSAHVRFGFDAADAMGPITLTLTTSGTTTTRTATSSAPIAVSPDGREAWVTYPDGGVVSVIDTASDRRIAQVALQGRPSSVAITPDGSLVLVACSSCNTLTVVDRATRAIRQVFAESDGIGRDPRNVVVSPDGTRAFVSAYVGDSVTLLRRIGDAFEVSSSIPVGRRPVGMSVTPDGKTVMAAHFMPRGPIRDNEGWVSLIDPDAAKLAGETILRDEQDAKEAACLAQIPGFDKYTGDQLSFEGVATQLAGVFLDPGGATGWTPGLRIAPFPILEGDLSNTGFQFAVKGANSPGALFPLDAREPRATRVPQLPSELDIADRAEGFLACDIFPEELETVLGFPVMNQPDEVQNPGTVAPSGSTPVSETGVSRFVGFSRGGRRALVLSYNADELMAVDGATHNPTSRRYLLLKGSNPIGLAVTPDGSKGYVVYENSTFASVLDLSAYADPAKLPPSYAPYTLDGSSPAGQGGTGIVTFATLIHDASSLPDVPPVKETGQVSLVDADPMDPVLRRGKVLFTSSSPVKYPTLSGVREASCSSCHPNGGNDGSIWPTMEGERRTISLYGGVAGRGWLHASATHQDVTAFATTIVKERLGGTGLSDADVHALSQYVSQGIPEVQRPVVDAALAARGQALFKTRCTMCHTGDRLTSGNPDPASKYGGGGSSGPGLFNVHSATSWAGAVLGAAYTALFPPTPKAILTTVRGDRELGPNDPLTKLIPFQGRPQRAVGDFKAPALVNVWEEVLFFHDGRAASVLDAVNDISPRTGAPLSAADASALVEYLKTL